MTLFWGIMLTILLLFLLLAFGINLYKHRKYPKFSLALYIFVLVLIFRGVITVFGCIETDEGLRTTDMNIFEKFMDSIVHTLQSFSMDEDYSQYTLEGKRLLSSHPVLRIAYGSISSILNLAAPLTGGFVLLELLTSLIPEIAVLFGTYRHKFVFSELNEMSITLAEDLYKNNYDPSACRKKDGAEQKPEKAEKWHKRLLNSTIFKPMIIFTDAYTDDESEISSELRTRAKAIKAVCIRTDLSKMSFHRSRSVTYLLIDNDPSSSIASLNHIIEDGTKWPHPDNKLKGFKLTLRVPEGAQEKRDDELLELFRDKAVYSVRGKDMYGGDTELKDLSGNKADSGTFGSHVTGAKNSRNKDDKPVIEVSFDLAGSPMDSSRPFEVYVDNLGSLFGLTGEQSEDVNTKAEITPAKAYEPRTKIVVFVQDEYQTDLVNNIYSRSPECYSAMLRVIRDYKNTAVNLMREVPLFLPLMLRNETKPEHLYVTILGGGALARESFKTVYWCGQMPGVTLHVTVLTDNADQFTDELNKTCPELLMSCKEITDILKVYEGREKYNPPYICAPDIRNIKDVRKTEDYPEGVLEKTDYYIIALGSDELDSEMTRLLSDKLAKMSLKKECPERCFIVPAVFNNDLAEALAERAPDRKKGGHFIIPFAVFDQRFSCKNVFMTSSEEDADAAQEVYTRKHQLEMQKDEYSHWANLARAIHAPYKLFSYGLLELINSPEETVITDEPEEIYRVKEGASLNDIPEPSQAYCEHRRWNAFMRSQGFTCPDKDEFAAYFELTSSHKNIPLKLHPCIVECDEKGTQALPDSPKYDKELYDRLDDVSIMVHHKKMAGKNAPASHYYGKKLRENDFKQWDYAREDGSIKKLLK